MSLNLIKVHDGVFRTEGGIQVTPESLDSLRTGWIKASIYKGGSVVHDETVRRADVIERCFCPDLYKSIETEIEHSLLEQVKKVFRVQFDGMAGSQIVRYKPGGTFEPHIDSGRTYPERIVSVIKYLSSEYEGGQTFFPDLGIEIGAIAPEFLIFFPELLHGARPVEKGDKLVFVTWLTKAPISW